ncbi:MAG: hypothetical protein AVDCRST_MAG73-3633 [uncultured Thermomicrobiales bacterium]|uniref:Membrane protein 6-pyruvoyl-tetrahydropterin synthase-related domain-containing protein n=1 Tax=uncultured Thermomicrobiales bacterium TaxID=1645740 RepID=A0A6J4UWT8_9BACT|nr:MAG: hypothetical protein AVDCRST_MAG73-3633 [uncultured Thermomicrobiales bacterium]
MTRSRFLPDPIWYALAAILAVSVAARLGGFDIWATVPGADRSPVRVVDTFATVDHPFHATRAETLRRALADGHPLRWIAHHQGGYPAEFYPLGVAWLEVGAWALLFGALPMLAIHKLVVIGLLLAPGVAFIFLARRDGRTAAVGFAALAAHVAVPGGPYHGGYRELVEWALVTNVAASAALLFVLHWLSAYATTGRRRAAVGASLAAALAVCTNPRSLVALGVVGAACWIAAVVGGTGWAATTRRVALVGGATALLAAPELVSLIRFGDLYFFVRYEEYETWREYWDASVTAVSWPVFGLGMGGAVLGLAFATRSLAERHREGGSRVTVGFAPGTVAATIALALYVVATIGVDAFSGEGDIFANLEAIRLMPFQRLLTIYLGAVALDAGLRWIGGRWRDIASGAGLAIGAAAVLLAWLSPLGGLADAEQGLFPVQTTAVAATAEFETAIAAADGAAAAGTAVLVLGSALGWHQQLWAPTVTERPLFYDNWLWYWHTRHGGPYDYRQGHAYPDPGLALAPEYLARHGIGAVAVTGAARGDASRSAALEPVRSGLFDVYAVRAPVPLATMPGGTAPDTAEIGPQRITLRGTSDGGELLVRHNWFPRWRATVNGESAAISRTEDGFMAVPVPAGPAEVELVYGVDGWDWVARGLVALGGIVLLAACRWRDGRPHRVAPTRPGVFSVAARERPEPTRA